MGSTWDGGSRPPTGVMALSMSAAVAPGGKFCAMTTKGPAIGDLVVAFAALMIQDTMKMVEHKPWAPAN